MLHAKLRNRTCQELERQGQGRNLQGLDLQGQGQIWSLRTRINITANYIRYCHTMSSVWIKPNNIKHVFSNFNKIFHKILICGYMVKIY